MKPFIVATVLLAAGGSAYAQSSDTTMTDVKKPAVATPNTTNRNAPVPGANSFTEAQAKSRLEDDGYSHITDLKLDENGIWVAKAQKDGDEVDVTLDYQGNIREGAR
jgi:hypothetical protein